MSFKSIMRYARANDLYEDVSVGNIAEEHRRKTGEDAVIAVDGVGCVWYLYRNCDFRCGGQYKEFREACWNFVEKFSKNGIRLVFFFNGLPPDEKKEKCPDVSKNNVEKIKQNLHVTGNASTGWKCLPEGLIPCARVNFRDVPSTEVRLCVDDYYQETAQFAASCKNCLGVMSNTATFLIYKDAKNMFTFGGSHQIDGEVRMMRFRSSAIASHLGIQQQDLPALVTFAGSDNINLEERRRVHGRLSSRYGRREHLASVVAELVKNNTVEEMCRIAFGSRWREFVDTVKADIDHFRYKRRATVMASDKSSWSAVLQRITAKHLSGEIPAAVLSVAKCHTLDTGPALEELFHDEYDGMATGDVLKSMRSRMYSVLLWESGDGPFHVEELVTRKTEVYREQVEVQKHLPLNVEHPGLLKLWAGDVDTRWRLFSWIVGAPDSEGSFLRSLEPQYLVVPAAALYFLRHEVKVLRCQEAEIFAVVAITVGNFTPEELAQKHIPMLDTRAAFLARLFVRTTLQVLDAAIVCGLSFPTEADCQLDAYFDGKFFHELYLKAKSQSFSRVGTHAPWDPSYLDPIHKLLNVVEHTHIAHE
ncbi:constitutive coactivator of peroxisome proliferator-activated receptor gamma-like [Schistocerca gregaria]|uniref:constitutive coactivator of peroxisome proliferator-activated receptor gamma-like n=1 Tax=Schistocerca gregaria TaxID=7010 RepID=UPI00211E8225|nr:constitutive coactivator of peroxisome proliferator-activated receptor gamma-like [Schistocerca gregaria]XP_049842680.1 constitutive coactivator of peroxisome proliferator-activated receptor gamma-like [Schistocerca gregaria]